MTGQLEAVPTVAVHREAFRTLCALLRDGASNEVLARRRGKSPETIKSHIRVLLVATGCPDRTSLVVALLRRQIRVVPHEGHRPAGGPS